MAINSTTQDIETLKNRHRELDRHKTTAEANLKNTADQLQKLKDEALAKYGTNDLEQLKAKLAELKAQNYHKRADYQNHLDSIELRLTEIEKQYASDE
jgi:chromosome segregation ATPase